MDYQSGAVRPVGSIEQGWQLIKNDYWTYVLMMLVFGAVVIVASLVLGGITQAITGLIGMGVGAATNGSNDAARTSAALVPHIVAQIISFFTSIILTTLAGVLMVGIYKSLSKLANGGGKAEFGDLFGGFEHIQACFVYAVILSVIQFIIGIVFMAIGLAVGVGAIGMGLGSLINSSGQLNPALVGGVLLVILALVGISLVLNLIISALTAFVFPLIAERRLSGGQAFLLSIKSGLANLVGLVLLLVLMFLMTLAGLFACLIGVLFVAPILVASLYAAFQSVFGRIGGYQQPYNAPPPPPNFGGQQPPFGQPPRY